MPFTERVNCPSPLIPEKLFMYFVIAFRERIVAWVVPY